MQFILIVFFNHPIMESYQITYYLYGCLVKEIIGFGTSTLQGVLTKVVWASKGGLTLKGSISNLPKIV